MYSFLNWDDTKKERKGTSSETAPLAVLSNTCSEIKFTNTANDYLVFDLGDNIEIAKYSLFGLTGKQIFSGKLKGEQRFKSV